VRWQLVGVNDWRSVSVLCVNGEPRAIIVIMQLDVIPTSPRVADSRCVISRPDKISLCKLDGVDVSCSMDCLSSKRLMRWTRSDIVMGSGLVGAMMCSSIGGGSGIVASDVVVMDVRTAM